MINSFAVAYYNCTPKIIAEQYVENVKDQLFDYKVMCFDGQPFCIEAAKERFGSNGPSFTFYDLEWNKLDVTSGHHPNEDIPHPNHLDEMLGIARILSAGFPHVRVDFFDTPEKLYVAEMTFFTGGGIRITSHNLSMFKWEIYLNCRLIDKGDIIISNYKKSIICF